METIKIHKFESAGLGKAPFNCVGIERKVYKACPGAPIQPGGACDYCGTGISILFQIISSDGKQFVVGSDCVRKTGDAGLKKFVADHERKERLIKAYIKRVQTNEALNALIARGDELAKFAHPKGYKNYKTKEPLTLLDYAIWYKSNSGTSGRAKAVKVINHTLSGDLVKVGGR